MENVSESAAGTYAVNPAFAKSATRLFYQNDVLVGATILGNLSHMREIKAKIREA